jgi:hypothetical protein
MSLAFIVSPLPKAVILARQRPPAPAPPAGTRHLERPGQRRS